MQKNALISYQNKTNLFVDTNLYCKCANQSICYGKTHNNPQIIHQLCFPNSELLGNGLNETCYNRKAKQKTQMLLVLTLPTILPQFFSIATPSKKPHPSSLS